MALALRAIWIGCLLAASIGAAHARVSGLFGVEFEPPFAYVVDRIEDRRGGGNVIAVRQSHRVRAEDASGEPQALVLVVAYTASERPNTALIRQALDADASAAAAKPGTRASSRFDIDGNTFHFIDGRVDGQEYPERMSIGGVVEGGVLRLSVLAKDASLLTPALAARLKAAKPDRAALLQAKADFDADAARYVREGVLDTPFSPIELDAGIEARLASSYLQADADGRPLLRSRTFSLSGPGSARMQGPSLSVGCGVREAFHREGADGFLALEEKLRVGDDDVRATNMSGPVPSTLAGMQARMVSAQGGKVERRGRAGPPRLSRRTDISRWLAEEGETVYWMEVERLDGPPVEEGLVQQLKDADPLCRLALRSREGAGS